MPTQPETPQPEPATPRSLETVALPRAGRGMLFGMTESGKSTLAEHLIRHWLATQPRPRVLIVDSKPRFRAEWRLNGMKAQRLYRNWSYGTPWPGSILLPLNDPYSELPEVWRQRGTVAIAQIPNLRYMPLLRDAIDAMYVKANAKYSQLVYVDETADFFGAGGSYARGDAILQTVRSGREKGVAFLGASQRPKGIPKSLLTETTMMAIYPLAFPADVDHLREMGLPSEAHSPRVADHRFYYFNRKSGVSGVYRLDLDSAKAEPKTSAKKEGSHAPHVA